MKERRAPRKSLPFLEKNLAVAVGLEPTTTGSTTSLPQWHPARLLTLAVRDMWLPASLASIPMLRSHAIIIAAIFAAPARARSNYRTT